MKLILQFVILLIFHAFISGHRSTDLQHHTNNTYFNVSIAKPCNHTPSIRHTIFSIGSATILCIGIAGNLMCIIVIQYSRRLRRRLAYVFVRSLAVADLGVSLFVTTVKVGYYWKDGSFCFGFGFCVFAHISDSLFPTSSISHLLIIGIDRWYATTYPYSYVSNSVGTKAKRIIPVVWVYSLVWTIMGIFTWDKPSTLAYKIGDVGGHRYCYSLNKYYHTTVIFVIYILPMAVVTCMNSAVLNVAMRQAMGISKRREIKSEIKRRRRHSNDPKALKTILTVSFAYTICWLPHVIIVMILYWYPQLLTNFRHKNELAYDIVTTVMSNILPTISSCVNPFIYFIVGSDFRIAGNDLYRKVTGKPRYVCKEHSLKSSSYKMHEHCTSVVNSYVMKGEVFIRMLSTEKVSTAT